MARQTILLCFDAFGTLFKPRRPVAEQYATVARQCGLDATITSEKVQTSFKSAFSAQSRAHPNYGKASGMGAEKWWTDVVHETFRPLVGSEVVLPHDLAPKLLHRFSSAEGYALVPGVDSLLRALKRPRPEQLSAPRILVGVITNSDDRVPGILSSLGLRVSPLRFGAAMNPTELSGHEFDVDLHCMSYDVGFAKPDRRIFDAAEEMAKQLVAAQDGDDSAWLKLYVGDDFAKDVTGAHTAGWNAVFVGSEASALEQRLPSGLRELQNNKLKEMLSPDGTPPNLSRASSVQMVLGWLEAFIQDKHNGGI